ncbi:hypothetical protein LQF12_04005 [Ruania suaedae]|uniref:MGH1-like glycoside hydrolase domain-containing protein n=1 Tax=Ruania suaedae TaxID=2897774 RepID=UPI001E39F1F9|nr:hypothetical protein [Ruania suaedae]UFU03784.1 hypothetical protein LQF12_04005 [Ruania suaedae]
MDIDAALIGPLRGLRTRPGTLLLGPVGRRLWVDYLEDRPGFSGRIDYIHKLNVPLLFTVGPDDDPAPARSTGEWLPSHLRTRQRLGDLSLAETRFLTDDDRAVSIQHWRNEGEEPLRIAARYDEEWLRAGPDGPAGARPVEHGFTLHLRLDSSDPRIWDGVRLDPGEAYDLTIVATARHDEQAPAADLTDPAGLLREHRRTYAAWFESVPELRCDDDLVERLWAYRWYILRTAMAEPGLGALPGRVMYEGRSHKMRKDPWRPTGWEFSKVIPLSTPLHLMDLRWRADPDEAEAVMRSIPPLQGEDGQLHAHTIGRRMNPYANCFGWSLAQVAQVHGPWTVPAEALAAAKAQVRGEARWLAGPDGLPVQHDHRLTGKEYQPSYWYFHDYPADPKDPATYTPLKRVDRAVYQHLNAAGVARLCAQREDPDEAEFAALAADVARSVLSKQWDPDSAFFYDLHHRTDERALVRNVVGFYPWWAGITGPAHAHGLVRALGGDHFGTEHPYPSVARDCPAFRAEGGWLGQFLKGRNGCMWNGPSWPYTSAIALDAIGRHCEGSAELRREFARGLRALARMHFRDADPAQPALVEHYDSLTGEPLSDEMDYNHSYVIDLLVRYVAGLQVRGDSLALRPIDVGLGRLDLGEVSVAGHRLSISLIGRGGRRHALVRCQGQVVFEGPICEGGEGVILPACTHP